MNLDPLSADLHRRFDQKMVAREAALPSARRAIRSSANAIRAIHRGEDDEAARLMDEARSALDEAERATTDHQDVRHAGFIHDAAKEYAEARLTEAVVKGKDLPPPDELQVSPSAYLNGMAETVGEARRVVLDLLRQGQVGRAEEILQAMDDMYYLLVTIDYPDAITGNLRRSTDVARSIIEKTRGDLTVALVQQDFRDALDRHAKQFRDQS